jgi:hypothetical protein
MREQFATADFNRKSRQTIALECNYLLAAMAHCSGSAPEKTLPPVVPNSIPRHVVVLLRVPD